MFNGLSWKQSIFIVSLHYKVYIKIFKDDKPRISVIQTHKVVFTGLETV